MRFANSYDMPGVCPAVPSEQITSLCQQEDSAMLYVINESSTNSFHNLAAEQVIFDELDRQHSYLYLWQNDNTVVVGRYQNTYAEIDPAYVSEHRVHVVRRLSGGGAVYHDLNNLNYSFITDAMAGSQINFTVFLQPIVDLLQALHVPAEISGRNDLLADGKKFSGNAQYVRRGRVMHHGTLMFDCDPEAISRILQVADAKIQGKGIASVRSRVCSLKDYLPADYSIGRFKTDLIRHMSDYADVAEYHFSPAEEARILELQHTRYETWDWNYGNSPQFSMTKSRYIPHVGMLDLRMNVKNGILEELRITGDFFSADGPEILSEKLTGCPLQETALLEALTGVDVGAAVHGLDAETLTAALLT